MKHLALLAVFLLATSGCAIVVPVLKFLAIPVARVLLDKADEKEESNEQNEDENKETQE